MNHSKDHQMQDAAQEFEQALQGHDCCAPTTTHEHHAMAGHDPMAAGPHEGHDKHAGHSPEMFKRKFWLSFALTIPAVLFSETVQGWLGLDWAFPGSAYLPAVLGVIIFLYGGLVFLKGAQAELADRLPGMMTLISLAITVAFGYSLAVTLGLVQGMDFWWELATLVTIMLLGHWLEMASVISAQGALKELAKLLPDEAEIVLDGSTKKVPVSELKVGDLVLIRPGAQVPADAEVVKGESDVNESMLTGESKPVKKTLKAAVIGGTINGSGALTVKIAKVGNDTALAGIMKLVAEAQSSKSKTQVLADKAAFYLTFVALGAAVITGVTWGIAGKDAAFILERIVTVLVIACPHALGLAVPLVTAISTTLAAKNGLLIRQRMALEAARNVNVVLFDKTGTLTKGQQGVTDIWTTGDYKTDGILHLAASLEQHSEHIVGRGIVQKAQGEHVHLDEVQNFTALPGLGVQGVLHGHETYVAASKRYLDERHVEVPKDIVAQTEQAAKDGKTEVYLLKDNVVIGALALADEIRAESRETITVLKDMGIQTAMITGDSKDVAQYVARELGLDLFFAEVRPEDKASKVKELQNKGLRVAMVGDGVNDAPALTQADIGIAIGAGTDVAIESAGIVLASSDPRGVANIVRLSRATYRKMLQNLAWATGYNALAIPLAAGVTAALGFVLSPAIGAVLMSLSTIIVALNAQLLRKTLL
jgi:Cu2+-exporting ATPase